LEAQSLLARITAGPPGIPADRLAYLREIYLKALASPELQADLARAKRSTTPMSGEDVTIAIQKALSQPEDVVATLKSLVTKVD
jgi:tripartite-type tricarboxylate transporter receptor subunit TctC